MSARKVVRLEDMTEVDRAVARDFLQSVIVVDDRALLGVEDAAAFSPVTLTADSSVRVELDDKSAELATSGRARRHIPKLQIPESTVKSTPEQALDAKVLVDGFAKQGLVCAVIRPDPSESPVDLTVTAARRADIVILDWELNHDDGASTLAIIRRLVHEEAESEPRGRLRLIAIYSGALALRQITSRLQHTLAQERGAVRFKKDGEFAIVAGSVRITVFAKPTTRLRYTDTVLRKRVITGAELPDRLIDEFAQMTAGLVPHVALASLAALRKNMHRVLGRLQSDLDAAYLWHRATQTRPADAETHLVDLVASELRSVLDDERVGNWADLEAIEQWITRGGQGDFAAAFGEATQRSADDVLALLKKGAAGKGEANKDVRDKFPKMSVERGAHREEISGFAKTAKAAKRSNENFAVLMSLRTRYEHPPPQLELGTILSRGRGQSRTYWLCLQPRCDSVRLEGDTAFPLLPLLPVPDGKKFDVLLPDGRNGYRRFRLAKKPFQIDMPVFAVNPTTGDTVVAERYRKGFVFRTCKGRRYDWVAELKPEYAQRIAQQVANEFSRIGLTESEWLRLWATKG